MQKLQDSVFSIVKTTNLSPAVFSFLQPSDELGDKTPLGGILKDTKHGWLALGAKFCVIDLRTGLKVAARTFGASLSNNTTVTCVVELPKPLTENSQQLIISLQCDDIGMICVLHINGSQILRCVQTDVVVTQLAVCDRIPDGPFTCFDGLVMAGTKRGEIFVFDLNRACLLQALKDISQGDEHLIQNEANPTNLSILPLSAIQRIEEQRELALENEHHLAILLNENSMVDGQYIFRNPDGTVRMKAKRDHIRVTVLEYIPQLGSLAVGFNFGAFQMWNIMTLDLEFTSQVNVECLPVTHFGFQEPCDDPRAFCYLWVVFSVLDRYEEEEFPLAVMYSLTYQGKRIVSDSECLYQDFSTAAIRFQIELGTLEEAPLLGGKCISCHSYSINSTLGDEGEDSMLNICQLVWECWGEDPNAPMQYGMLLFDLDQWYKDQMPATYRLESTAFMSATWCSELAARGSVTLHARLAPASVCAYSHATRLEEHFYPNSLQYDCICLNTSEALTLRTVGIQRQIVAALEAAGGAALLHPARLHAAAARAGLAPHGSSAHAHTQEDQRRYLLSVALEARLSRFLKRCAHDWATGSHSGVGCTLTFLVDWAWQRAVELKENAKELTAPLFVSSFVPDSNVVRCLEHCVQQLTQLTGLMDAILTKCCNLVVPDALSEMEERHVGIGCVSLYFRVVQWLLRVGLLPERGDGLPFPAAQLRDTYRKRRMKLNRLQENSNPEENGANKSCSLLYIDQLIEHEFGGDKIHQMWIEGGSESHGLYPPPSLYSLLRLYLLPEIAEEHKHSLVLYLLVDYSMIYDDVRWSDGMCFTKPDWGPVVDDGLILLTKVRYEAVIRRLMQFPTMFGLSNTAIKATQAFWHLDHRDFDFALDQLQCLTGNTLHEWQHRVVLASLRAQHKAQAALHYLHVRRPPPPGATVHPYSLRATERDKLADWQSCVSLYLSRALVCEALDVARMCVQHAPDPGEKVHILNFFFKGCRNTGNLSKILQVTLLPFEEEVFVKYLENCKECQTSDILIMYYLQQARYLEAERYNNKLKRWKPQRHPEMSTSVESLLDAADREGARDALVEVVCAALPPVAGAVAHAALDWRDVEPHVNAPKPMSVFVQAKSPKNTFTYKSSFIQDTIENASETWMNRPKMRKGLKRALDIEETPFICTPRLVRTRSLFPSNEQSPPKRPRLSQTPTPRAARPARGGAQVAAQVQELLAMPPAHSPHRPRRERAGTPHSILKLRRNEREEAPSPVDSRYLGDSDDELLETASSHTHYSDTTNKHLRFTIPTASESGSTPSPPLATSLHRTQERNGSIEKEMDISTSPARVKEMDVSTTDSYATTTSHAMNENHPLESPPKKLATESIVQPRKSYKDTVRARRSLSISANSSLSEDPNTSIESIADIPITLINPRYSGERKKTIPTHKRGDLEESGEGSQEYLEQCTSEVGVKFESTSVQGIEKMDQSSLSKGFRRNLQRPDFSVQDIEYKPRLVQDVTLAEGGQREAPHAPRGRRGIRPTGGESTPLRNRSRSGTPERQDSPILTPLRSSRIARSRSKTPELSPRSSPLAPILEQPKQEVESEPHAEKTSLSVPKQMRSRSRTPERMDKGVSESPKLEVIKESPTKSSTTESPTSSPSRRNLRSRSRTPEVEIVPEPITAISPRSLRSRSKTPEKLMSPKKDHPVRAKKSLSRIVLEANTFAKTKQTLETLETEITESRSESNIECTPKKTSKQGPSLMDVTLSPIINKSVLQSSTDSALSETVGKDAKRDDNASELSLKPLPAFTTLHETCFEKSVLRSYQSSVADSSVSIQEEIHIEAANKTPDSSLVLKPLPAFTTINETDFNKSVLHSCESSLAETSRSFQEPAEKQTKVEHKIPKPFAAFTSMIETDFERSVLRSHQSSVAETPDDSRDTETNASSLITNDSDTEMNRVETQDNAAQVEKEKIVEIEREINEIEGNISNDSESGDSDSTVESVDDEDSDEKDSEDSDSSELSSPLTTEEEENENGDEAEVISIEDSDSDTDEESSKQSNDIAEDEVVTEKVEQDVDISENVEASSTDPLNQGQVSLMTDDNSYVESDQSINLNYSDEKIEPVNEGVKNGEPKEQETHSGVEIQVIVEEIIEEKMEEPKHASESMDVVDTSASETELKETVQPEFKETRDNKNIESSSERAEKIKVVVDKTEDVKLTIDAKKSTQTDNKTEGKAIQNENIEIPSQTTEVEMVKIVKPIQVEDVMKSSQTTKTLKPSQMEDINKPTETVEMSNLTQSKDEATELVKPAARTRMRAKSTSSNKSTKEEHETPKVFAFGKSNTETEIKASKDTLPKVVEEPIETEEPITPVTRKRASSNASAKSKGTVSEASKEPEAPKEIEATTKPKESDEPRTPVTRKRANSNASNKSKTGKETAAPKQVEETKGTEKTQESDEPKTPVSRKRANSSKPDEITTEETPARRRAKTPTSAEMRKIITRRVSREMAGKLDESNQSMEESVSLTPARRSARTRSKNIDDNESVASGSSIVSTRSRASEDGDAKPGRKGRKSVLPTKPDLSVIPEAIAEESSMMASYSDSRRLTRRQQSAVTQRLEPPAPGAARAARRRVSAASGASAASAASVASRSSLASEHDDEEPPPFDVQSIDRISLLNKTDFEGPPDTEELQNNMSPESVASDASKQRRSRSSRAASETRTMPVQRAAKINRRVASVDIGENSDVGSPGPSGTDSPARGRRASFNRACEALHTPKGRRTSTDVRRSTESPVLSPAVSEAELATPTRRPRRASTASNTSQTKSDTGKRSKKMPVLEEEDKGTKK